MRRLTLCLMLLLADWLGSQDAGVALGSPRPPPPVAPLSETASPRPILHQVRQIRRLTQEQAAQSVPVHLHGTVTDVSGFSNSFFFQDAAEGISVEGSSTPVVLGDRIELTGASGTGMFAPIVLASQVAVVGRSPLPVAPKVTFADMAGGAEDSQRIEIEGIVHSAKPATFYQRENLILSVEIGGATVRVILQDFTNLDRTSLTDSRVRIRGVCITDYNDRRQFVGVGMLVPQRSDLEILEPARDPYSIPRTRISDALRFGQASHQIRITGAATYSQPGVALYLQDGRDAIRVETTSRQFVQPGSRVEAIGFPAAGQYAPVLQDGLYRVLGDGPLIQPLPIKPQNVTFRREEFSDAAYDEQLVQIQGEVVESRLEGDQRTWLLSDGGKTYGARLTIPPSSKDTFAGLGPGSVLLIAGICTVQIDATHTPVGFGLLVRSPQDITVIRRPTWWTPQHLVMMLVALATASMAIVLWVVMLRRRVREQTTLLRTSEETLRHQATHDGLTGLLNRNAILEALSISVDEARRKKTLVAVAIIDLDHFKWVNDTLGHLAGDQVLRESALRLSAGVRKSDLIGRYGGEEFLIIFRRANQDLSLERCELLRAALSAEPVHFGNERLRITGSIGLACSYAQTLTAIDLVAQADSAMYEAKTTGRDRVIWFSPRIHS